MSAAADHFCPSFGGLSCVIFGREYCAKGIAAIPENPTSKGWSPGHEIILAKRVIVAYNKVLSHTNPSYVDGFL